MNSLIVCRDPNVMGGTPVFCGTRVPVQTLLLVGYPSVSRHQVVSFLEEAKDR